MQVTEEELVKAIRWKLGIPVDGDPGRSEEICRKLLGSSDPRQREMTDRICRFLSSALENAVRQQLALPASGSTTREELEFLDSLWRSFKSWLGADEMKRSPRVSRLLREAAFVRKGSVPEAAPRAPQPPAKPPTAQPRLPAPKPAADPAPTRPTLPAPKAAPPSDPALPTPEPPQGAPSPGPALPVMGPQVDLPPVNPEVEVGPAMEAPISIPEPQPVAPPESTGKPMSSEMSSDANRGRSPGPQWQYRPVPANEPDAHEESATAALTTPESWPLIGARVRGKKHKHEGTNCDDWFQVATSGRWTLIAVADGAGSKRLSRVGARASCQEAIRLLSADLERHQVRDRTALDNVYKKDDTGEGFVEADLEYVQKHLHRAMLGAFFAVEKEANLRADSAPHQKLLGRKPVLNDFSATLLLAVHSTIKVQGKDMSFMMACQVGDGLTAAVDFKGNIKVLGEPDSGDYSGETDFLTSQKKLQRINLCLKTHVFIHPIAALMVMTDGVADDYFPPIPGMARLYADLLLNGVLEERGPSDEELLAALRERTPPNFDPADGCLDTVVDAVTPEGPRPVRIRSTATYASELGLEVEQLVASTPLLLAGTRGAPFAGISAPKDRLKTWLDSYQVRGSFDDRTLVVLHRPRTGD